MLNFVSGNATWAVSYQKTWKSQLGFSIMTIFIVKLFVKKCNYLQNDYTITKPVTVTMKTFHKFINEKKFNVNWRWLFLFPHLWQGIPPLVLNSRLHWGWLTSNSQEVGWRIHGLNWHAHHTLHHKLPYKKRQLMVIPFVSCFYFYGHSMESLSAINLYGQLMTSMLFCMVVQWLSCFFFFFFDKQLPISNLHSSE